MVWLSQNAGKTYWLRSDAGYWHHGDPSFKVCSWSWGPSWQWADDEDPQLESSQLCRIRQVRLLVGQDVAQQLVSSFILSGIDYCNSLLSCLPRSTIQPLQHVMNVAAQVIMNLSLRDHVKPALKQLHWLLVEQRITYKLCMFMHHIHAGRVPQYLADCVSTVSALSGRYWLRSTGSADYVLPRTRTKFGERGFFYCGPAAWNTLPSDLHDITDTDTFRKLLKSVIFDRAYHWLLLALLTCRIAAPYKFYVDWLIANRVWSTILIGSFGHIRCPNPNP